VSDEPEQGAEIIDFGVFLKNGVPEPKLRTKRKSGCCWRNDSA
jgi:hypothetical protein